MRPANYWKSYIAFLASFCYAGVIWLNHRAVFAMVRYCYRSLHLANLFLLLTSALIPFPTAVLSATIQGGNEFDAKVAVTSMQPSPGDVPVMARSVSRFEHTSIPFGGRCKSGLFPERFRATLGVILYAIAGVAGWLSTPKVALLIFLALPVFYGITSEGLTETRIRLQFGKSHRGSPAKHGALVNDSREGLRAE
jgi:uncharacterized membrane protein